MDFNEIWYEHHVNINIQPLSAKLKIVSNRLHKNRGHTNF
jgi:hypothetical protein